MPESDIKLKSEFCENTIFSDSMMDGFASAPPVPLVESYNSCTLTLWQAIFTSAGNGMSIAGSAATFLICWVGFFTREVYLRILHRREKNARTVAVEADLTGGESGGGHGGHVEMTEQQAKAKDNFMRSFIARSPPPSRPSSAGKRGDGGGGGGGGEPLTNDERALLRQLVRDRDEHARKLLQFETLIGLQSAKLGGDV